MDDEIRAFHNVCRHRGNKLVWTDHPAEEISGTCRQFACKYHGWTVRSRRPLVLHPSGGRVLRDRQGRLRPRAGALRGVAGVHLRELRQGAGADAHRVPRPDDHRDRLPVREADGALLLPRRHPQQLEGLPGRLPGVLSPAHPPRPPEPGHVGVRLPAARVLHHALPGRRPASRGFDERGRWRAPAAGDATTPSSG